MVDIAMLTQRKNAVQHFIVVEFINNQIDIAIA